MDRLRFFFSSLSDRERWWLIAGIYGVVILFGGLILFPAALKSYYAGRKELKVAVAEFYSFKQLLGEAVPETSAGKVSLKEISELLEVSGIKPFVVSIKPAEGNFEIKIEGAPAKVFASSLRLFKDKGFSVPYVNVDAVTGKIKAIVVVSGEKR
ncbi:hypothetical protein [Desulfurobacterium sp.]